MSSRPSRKRCCTESSSGKRLGDAEGRDLERRGARRRRRARGWGRPRPRASSRSPSSAGTTTGTRPFLVELLRKMSPKRGEITASKPCLLDGPHGVLARRAGAEVGAGHEDAWRRRSCSLVEHEVAVVAPLGEEALLEAGALDLLEPVAGDDLVGVDVGAVERHGGALHDADGLPSDGLQVLGGGEVAGDGGGGGDGGGDEVGAPAPALAALEVAVRGATRSARRARACRGSWPGTSSSPGRASRSRRRVNTTSRPSASAWALTAHEPGHDERADAGRRPGGPGPRRRRPAGPRCGCWCTSR